MSDFLISSHEEHLSRRKGWTEDFHSKSSVLIPPTTLLLLSSTMVLISKIAFLANPICLLIVRVMHSAKFVPTSSAKIVSEKFSF